MHLSLSSHRQTRLQGQRPRRRHGQKATGPAARLRWPSSQCLPLAAVHRWVRLTSCRRYLFRVPITLPQHAQTALAAGRHRIMVSAGCCRVLRCWQARLGLIVLTQAVTHPHGRPTLSAGLAMSSSSRRPLWLMAQSRPSPSGSLVPSWLPCSSHRRSLWAQLRQRPATQNGQMCRRPCMCAQSRGGSQQRSSLHLWQGLQLPWIGVRWCRLLSNLPLWQSLQQSRSSSRGMYSRQESSRAPCALSSARRASLNRPQASLGVCRPTARRQCRPHPHRQNLGRPLRRQGSPVQRQLLRNSARL